METTVGKVAGILLLTLGAILPMAMLFRMNTLLGRKPAPRPAQVALWIALNGVLPVALILAGMRLLSTRVAASSGLRIANDAAWLASAVLAVLIVATGRLSRRTDGRDGR